VADRVGNPYDFSYGKDIQASMGCPVGQQSLTCFFNPAAFVIPRLAPGQKVAHQFANEATAICADPAR
jgi:hypothetical protein